MPLRPKVTPLEVAITQLGVQEGIPEDENRILEYLGGDERERGLGLDWCAAFVLWCHQTSEPQVKLPGNFWRNRACWRLQRNLEASGCRVWRPKPGDLFFLSRWSERLRDPKETILQANELGHVGFVRRPTERGVHGWWSVEGNVARAVRQRLYLLPHPRVLAYYRPSLLVTDRATA